MQRVRCDCGADFQTITHIVTERPGRLYPGDREDCLEATKSATDWKANLNQNFYICKFDDQLENG